MFRRRAAADRLVVDLGAFGDVGTSGGDAGWDDEPGAPTGTDEPDDGRSRVRRLVAAGTAAFVLLAAWGAATEVGERHRVQRLLAAPGGVLSLAQPPRERWSAATDSSGTTAFLPGLVVVHRGTALHALDAGTGTERWHVEVGADPRCTVYGSAQGAGALVDPLVCWNGPKAASPAVTVVRTDGSSTTRALPADVAWAAATADGGLVTLTQVGPPPPADQVTVTQAAGGALTVNGALTQGQDVVVRLEDATTGAERWQRTVPFHAVEDPLSCLGVDEDDSGGTATYSISQRPSVVTFAALVEVYGCGVQAAFTLDGAVAADQGGSAAWWYVEPYVDGGVLEQTSGYDGDGGQASVLHGAGGAGAVSFATQVLNPWATDGTSSDLVLAGSAGTPLTAYGRDGTVRWHATQPYADLLVRGGGVAVMATPGGDLAGVDLRTGEQLWTNSDLLTDPSTAYVYPRTAVTDGRVAAVELGTDATSAAQLVAVDLATGAVRWRTTLPGPLPMVAAVQGHLVVTSQEGDGTTDPATTPGTVRELG